MVGLKKPMSFRSIAVVGLFLSSHVALSHHSDAGIDDESIVVVEGEVTEFRWRQPHVYAEIETLEKGDVVRWDVQLVAVNVLARRGWSAESLVPGDQVIARLHPASNGRRYGKLSSIIRADGSPVAVIPDAADVELVKATSMAGKWSGQRPASSLLPSPPPRPKPPSDQPPCTSGFDCFFKTRLVLTDDGKAAMAAYDPLSSQNPESTCIGRPTPAALVSARGYLLEFELSDAEEKILIRSEYFNEQRTVWMDGRDHPDGTETFRTGHSIGHWEGNTLIVDTRNFSHHRSPYQIGVPSGSRKHVVERYRLNDDGFSMAMQFTLEDPEFIAEPLHHKSTFYHAPHMKMLTGNCDPKNTSRFLR